MINSAEVCERFKSVQSAATMMHTYGATVLEGGVEYGDTGPLSGLEIDLIGPDAEAADAEKALCRLPTLRLVSNQAHLNDRRGNGGCTPASVG